MMLENVEGEKRVTIPPLLSPGPTSHPFVTLLSIFCVPQFAYKL